jgi:hypothetical protein
MHNLIMNMFRRLNETGKKFARYYRAADGSTMMGYLLPFTLHAHPDVQKVHMGIRCGCFE